jgi:iron complex transport system substrate-binding protein
MPGPVSDTIRAVVICLLALFIVTQQAGAGERTPKRIVSLNLCTDQLVMMIAQPDHIAAVSYHAVNPDTSNLAVEARDLPITSTLAEDVITLKPDLVIAGTFTTRPTIALLRRLGIQVLEVPPANSIADIRRNVEMIADALGEQARGEEIIAQFDAELKAAERPIAGPRPIAAPYYGGNNTSGSGTLLHEMLERAGLRNLAAEKGLSGPSRLSLEQMVFDNPDLIILGLSSVRRRSLTIGNLDHPAMHRLLNQVPSLTIPDRLWICGTPHIAQVVTRLAEARERIAAKRSAQ